MKRTFHRSTWRAAVDTGTAFTSASAIAEDSGETFSTRVPSTPGDPAAAAVTALAGLCEKAGLDFKHLRILLLGSTAAFSAAESGAGTALIVTRGFKDILRTGGPPLPPPYDLWNRIPPPPVGRDLTFEASERMLPGGEVLDPLKDEEVERIVPDLAARGARSVAVCFLHSYCNPLHEKRVRDILAIKLPGIPVTLSSEVLPAAGEYFRATAAAVNAAFRPHLAKYLGGLAHRLAALGSKPAGVFFLQSDGSAITPALAVKESARTALSGPAGGALACINLSRSTGRPNIIALDMGVTGSRLCVIHREPAGLPGRGTAEGGCPPPPVPTIYTITPGGDITAIAGSLRQITAGMGHDPGEFTLVAFGGAGPGHAAELAYKAGIPLVLIPPHPGSQSSLGMLLADIRMDYSVVVHHPEDGDDPEFVNAAYRQMEDAARLELSPGGSGPGRIMFTRSADLRYTGLPYTLNLQVPAGKMGRADLALLGRAFKVLHQSEYGLSPDKDHTQIAALRLTAQLKLPDMAIAPREIKPPARRAHAPAVPAGSRKVFFDSGPLVIPVYFRKYLEPLSYIAGPAVVDQEDTATVVCPGMSASVDAMGNIIIDVGVK